MWLTFPWSLWAALLVRSLFHCSDHCYPEKEINVTYFPLISVSWSADPFFISLFRPLLSRKRDEYHLLSLDLSDLVCWSLLLWTKMILWATVRTVSSAHHPSPVLRDVIITDTLYCRDNADQWQSSVFINQWQSSDLINQWKSSDPIPINQWQSSDPINQWKSREQQTNGKESVLTTVLTGIRKPTEAIVKQWSNQNQKKAAPNRETNEKKTRVRQ